MKMSIVRSTTLVFVGLTGSGAAQAPVQPRAQAPTVEQDVVVDIRRLPSTAATTSVWFGQGAAADTVDFTFDVAATPFGIEGAVVTDAPYEARAVTEVVQLLADGNRIVRRSEASISRDAAGRTRQETGLAVLGPLVGADVEQRPVLITDPVAGTSYVLDQGRRTARKLPRPRLSVARLASPGPEQAAGLFTLPVPPPPMEAGVAIGAAAIAVARVGAATMPFEVRAASRGGVRVSEPVSETLGTKMIEGVLAEGTRTVVSIPAGQIGNEREIEIVSERWYAKDLQVLVLSRHTDPRFGDTTYSLVDIVRGEPAAALFEVPSDYTLIEVPAGPASRFIPHEPGAPAR
jgi:hypothetical protein